MAEKKPHSESFETVRQKELESQCFDAGAKKLQDFIGSLKRYKDLSKMPSHLFMFRHNFYNFMTAVGEVTADSGRRSVLFSLIEDLGLDTICYIAASCIFEKVGLELMTLQEVANKIGKCIELEARLQHESGELTPEEEIRKRAFLLYRNKLCRRRGYVTNAKKLEYLQKGDATRRAKLGQKSDFQSFSNRKRISTGAKLIDIFIAATGFIEMKKYHDERNVKKQHLYLDWKPEVKEWIEQVHESMAPHYSPSQPMFIPPVERKVGSLNGGYQFKMAPLSKLVKKNRKLVHTQEPQSSPDFIKTINNLQNVQWVRNNFVINTIKRAIAERIPVPMQLLAPKPKQSEKPSFEEKNPAQLWAYRAKLRKFYQERMRTRKLRDSLDSADLFEGIPCYLVHEVDFRGRIYPKSSSLNPQKSDLNRALCLFANPVALGEHGLVYLAAHGANVAKDCPISGENVDKLRWEEKVNWAHNMRNTVEKVACDPLGTTEIWMKTDKPYSFLAWCEDFARYFQDGSRFTSRLPVNIDGTCNGYQHYAALLRDENLAKYTNLVPGEKNDLYIEMGKAIKQYFQNMVDVPYGFTTYQVKAARDWLKSGFINRSFVKNAVKSLAYGGRYISVKDNISDFILDYREQNGLHDGFLGQNYSGLGSAVTVMARAVHSKQVKQVLGNAHVLMENLKEYANKNIKENHIITLPSGFQMRPQYIKDNLVKAQAYVGTSSISYIKDVQERKFNPRATATAFPANFIHALDASHLSMTLNKAYDLGLKQLSSIHDCFVAPAGNMGTLHDCILQSFVEQYQDKELLYKLLDFEGTGDVKEKFDFPEQGDFDINSVLESDYSFY